VKLLVLGAEGMVGHVVSLYLFEQGHIVNTIAENDVFPEKRDLIEREIENGQYDAVLNCTAVINQDAEDDKIKAITINTLLPHYLEAITKGLKTVIVHRSTDCIFSGEKGNYSLEDTPDAKSFYARTKALGELNNEKDITIRTSLIGPEKEKKGTGLFNWFYNQRGVISGYANSIWTGLTTIEFAKEIEWLLLHKKHGIFQLVPSVSIGKYELLLLFEKYYPNNRTINRIENKRVDKSLVPVCDGLVIPDYETQICEMRRWTDNHFEIYGY